MFDLHLVRDVLLGRSATRRSATGFTPTSVGCSTSPTALTSGPPAGVRGMDKHVVRLWIETDCWRYQCRRGHASWVPNETSFYCQGCGVNDDIEGAAYTALIDTASGEDVGRDEFHLLGTRFGPPPENVQSMLTEY